MSAKKEQVLLALILALALGWDLWAIGTDQLWTTADNYLRRSLDMLLEPTAGWFHFLANQAPKGPTLPLLSAPLIALTGSDMFGGRLLSVLCHGGLMLLAARLASRLLPGKGAGLWAALLCAATPMIFGWFRLEYGEPLLACLLLAAMGMLIPPPRGVGRGAALGAVVALGLLTKPGFAVYMLFPAIWCLPAQLAARQRALAALSAVAVAALPVAPWAALNFAALSENYAMSGGAAADRAPLEKLELILAMPGAAPLLAAAVASLLLLWRRGRLRAWTAGLLLGAVLTPPLLFVFWFHLWSRYLMPALALAAAVTGPGFALLLSHLSPRRRRILAGVAAAALVGVSAWFNIAPPPRDLPRETHSGMLAPDRRPHEGLTRAVARLRQLGAQRVLLAPDSCRSIDRWEGLDTILRFRRTPLRVIPLARLREGLAAGRTCWALLLSVVPLEDLEHNPLPALPIPHSEDPHSLDLVSGTRWLLAYPHRETLLQHRDPDGVYYHAMKLRPPTTAEDR